MLIENWRWKMCRDNDIQSRNSCAAAVISSHCVPLWEQFLGAFSFWECITPQRKLGYDIAVWRLSYQMWLFNLTRCNSCGYWYQNLSVLLLNPLFSMQTLCWLEARAHSWRLQGLRFRSVPHWVHQLVGTDLADLRLSSSWLLLTGVCSRNLWEK